MEETDNILSPFCFAEGMKHDAETNVLFFLVCLQVATPGVQTKPNAKYHSIFFRVMSSARLSITTQQFSGFPSVSWKSYTKIQILINLNPHIAPQVRMHHKRYQP